MQRYIDNIQLNCTKKDAILALFGVLPFVPASYYIVKIIKNMKINKTGIKYWNPAKVNQTIQEHYGIEVI